MFKVSTKSRCRAGIIAGLYVVLSLITFPIASGAMQLRVSEGLTILPLFIPESVFALFVGCVLCNLITGCAILDVVLGSLVTLVAGLCTFAIGKLIKNSVVKMFLGGLFPVLFNAFFLPLIWLLCYGALEQVYIVQVGWLLASQAIAVYGVGTPTFITMQKLQAKGFAFLN